MSQGAPTRGRRVEVAGRGSAGFNHTRQRRRLRRCRRLRAACCDSSRHAPPRPAVRPFLHAARYADNSDPMMPPLLNTYRFLNITNLADVRRGAKPVLVSCGQAC